MTIYRLYTENGHRAGFWVQHRTWGNICAKVESIAGRESGALPGVAPLHDNAPVEMRLLDVRSGRPIPAAPAATQFSDRNFTRIAEPFWYHALQKRNRENGERIGDHGATID